MYHSKLKTILFGIVLVFCSLISAATAAFVYYAPDNKLSVGAFKAGYLLWPNKMSYLEFYSPARREIHNGVSPIDVNVFLTQRLQSTDNDGEIAAITHYFSLQSGRRQLGCLRDLSDGVKPKVVAQLVKELDDNTNLDGKIILLEEVRTGKYFGKGSFGLKFPSPPQFTTEEQKKEWFESYFSRTQEELLLTAKEKYQEWWKSDVNWDEKKTIDPLAGTDIDISRCCG